MKPLILLFTSVLLSSCAGRVADCDLNIAPGQALPKLNAELIDHVPQGNDQRELTVFELFKAMDCPLLETQLAGVASERNVMCTVQGESAHEIVVGAHFDQHGRGQGVIDNWTGIAFLLSLTSYYLNNPPQHTIRFVAFAGEEQGMVGSRAFMKGANSGGVPRPLAMINLDSFGVTPLQVDVRSDHTLRCLLNSVADNQGEQVGTSRLRLMVSDWEPFRQDGIAVLGLLGINRQGLPLIHSNKDERSNINMAHLEQSFQLIAETVDALDRSPRILAVTL